MEIADNQQTKHRPLMRRDKAAVYLREDRGLPYSKNRLAKDAVNGSGPLFRYCGKIPLYDPDDLDAFVSERLSAKVHSTAGAPLRDGGRRGRPRKIAAPQPA